MTTDVCKLFRTHLVLNKVSLTAERGAIFSLLGPNGAGKTTMVRILSTLISADSGCMRVAGHDVLTNPDGVRGIIVVTGQFSAVDNLLTGAENLHLIADLRHLGRAAGSGEERPSVVAQVGPASDQLHFELLASTKLLAALTTLDALPTTVTIWLGDGFAGSALTALVSSSTDDLRALVSLGKSLLA
jgi:ABC-type uncharacterized transport system ATPase subunit